MDRDIYLILIGAGISLASSIVTLILQFVLGQWSERLHSKREEKQQQSRDIRNALLDKSVPSVGTETVLNKLLGRIRTIDSDNLDLPTFLRRKEGGQTSPYFWAVLVGIVVFFFWILYVLVT